MSSHLRQCVRSVLLLFTLVVVAACSVPQSSGAAPYAAYVMDARTGETLYSNNADTRLHPASLTKMMTLYLAFQAIERGEISLDSLVKISKHAAAQPPSRLGLKPGQKIALRHLIRAAAIKSANDAATAIGEAVGGSEAEFAKKMTRTAKAIGMNSTSFANANGLTATAAFSAKNRDPGPTLTAYLLEANWDIDDHHTVFGRFENVKNDELFPDHDDPLHEVPFRVSKFQAGYAYRLPLTGPLNLALGGTVSTYTKPNALDAAYSNSPMGFTLFAKLSLGH